MTKMLLLIIFSALVTHSQQSMNYRLPLNSRPIHYNLKFIPHIVPGNFTFDGEAEISLVVFKKTKNLTMHSSNLEIHEEDTILIPGNQEIIKPNQHIYKKGREFLILKFPKTLQPGNHTLKLKFTGELNDNLQGFFRDSYVNDKKEEVYLAGTLFEPEFARRAFPCWDEPALKATFDIAIKHFPNYTVLSNMPVRSISNQEEFDRKVWTEFETTPIMSTYLVAFSVSDFVKISNPRGNLTVWSRKKTMNSSRLVYEAGLKALSVLEEYTGIPYLLPKIDVIAIPNFPIAAMENWGLISFSEREYLRNKSPRKVTASVMIVHEIAHQWFGNLVSPAWWEDLWITEGLANHIHTSLYSKVMDVPKLTNYVQSDGFLGPSPLPLLQKIDSKKEAKALTKVVHDRAGAMMRMLSGLISGDVFQVGVRKVLQKYQFRSISTDEFLGTMQEALDESTVPTKFDVKKVMRSFLSQVGFPVVIVDRNYTSGIIKLTQKCSWCPQNDNDKVSKWWIPINFATNSTLNFSSTLATHWMDPEKEELIIEGVDPNDWIILNIQNSAHYRVKYDEKNWEKIADYLNSDKFSGIHYLNRAKIQDDALWFWKQGELEENIVFNLISYIHRENNVITKYVNN